MVDYNFTTTVFIGAIAVVFIAMEAILIMLRYVNDKDKLFLRDIEGHVLMITYALSISGSIGAFEIAWVGQIASRIRVYGFIGALILLSLGVIQYLSLVDEYKHESY